MKSLTDLCHRVVLLIHGGSASERQIRVEFIDCVGGNQQINHDYKRRTSEEVDRKHVTGTFPGRVSL